MFVTTVDGVVEAAREADLRSAWEDMSADLPRGVHRIVPPAWRGRDVADRHVLGIEGGRDGAASIWPADGQDDVRASRIDGVVAHVDGRGPVLAT
jgi:hypothetical protein